jgi:diguanylate cyclase (GGDEF)-like protein
MKQALSEGLPPGPVAALTPSGESRRLEALRSYSVLDTEPEQVFDDLAKVAAVLCDAPIALVSLVDAERQWFKARVGVEPTETPRELSFCAHAILEPSHVFTVTDAYKDSRFSGNPLVTADPLIRFYAGVPLVSAEGQALGTLCVMDRRPRELGHQQEEALRALARQVVSQLELRRGLLTATESSLTDALTGVANRRAFEARLAQEWNRLARSGGTLSLLLMDVDKFKSYNDTFGHLAGDKVLQQLAHAGQAHFRSCDLFARWGGEEFAAILPEAGKSGAWAVAERLRALLAARHWPNRPITVSVGLATMAASAAVHSHLLVNQADGALYQAKNGGRNRVVAHPGSEG